MSDVLILDRIRMRVHAGVSIDAAAKEACRMAGECPVEFVFNETLVTAWHPDQPIEEIIGWYNMRRTTNT